MKNNMIFNLLKHNKITQVFICFSCFSLFFKIFIFNPRVVTTQHPYNKVGLWPQNLTKSMLKSIKMQKDERFYPKKVIRIIFGN